MEQFYDEQKDRIFNYLFDTCKHQIHQDISGSNPSAQYNKGWNDALRYMQAILTEARKFFKEQEEYDHYIKERAKHEHL